jgi:hypothetical protein
MEIEEERVSIIIYSFFFNLYQLIVEVYIKSVFSVVPDDDKSFISKARINY